MSRTYRRQKGNRSFADANAKNVNNPFYCRDRFEYRRCYKEWEEVTVVWTSPYTKYNRREFKSEWVTEIVGWAKPDWERCGLNESYVRSMQRDHIRGDGRWVKEYSRPIRRQAQKKELNRLKKMNDYEDMQYIDQVPTIGDWWYWN